MSNDDRSRRVWRLLERGWTSARALRDAIQEVRGRVDEARVRLSDEVVSRIAGQPVRTQNEPWKSDPLPGQEPPAPVKAPPADADLQNEISAAADAVGPEAVVAEAAKSVPAPEPVAPPPAAPAVQAFAASAEHVVAPEETPEIPTPAAPAPKDSLPEPSDEITALARDAEWLFVYWDIGEQALERAGGTAGDPQYLVRIYQEPESGLVHQSAAAVPAGRRYVRVPFADSSYSAALWVRRGGEENVVARSASVSTPPAIPRPAQDAAMVSSVPHRGVLNSAWDLTRVPRLQPTTPPYIPSAAPSATAVEPATSVEVGATVTETPAERPLGGSEERLSDAADRRTAPHDRSDLGSEERLGGGSEPRLGYGAGSEPRFDPTE